MDPAKLRAPTLSDAMRKLHPHAHHVDGLVSPTPERAIFGPAATMLFAPTRADVPKDQQDFERRLTEAASRPGMVLVAAAPGAEDAAIVGGVRLAMMEARGYAGLVTTARMRDFDEARATSLACWCGGETPLAGSASAMPVAVNVPLALGNATVLPGDFVYAGSAGVVIVPARDVERVLGLAEEIEAEDAARVRKARGR
ncbi:MAG TPA: RraA family protein [Candidatus Thermoplasmatota archaeon]|nr:RraA family protein [Candidatus Thermoplasmatota archaeon]